MELFSTFWHLLCLQKYEVDFLHLPYILKSVYFWHLPCLSVLTIDIYLSLFEKFNFWHLPCLSEEVQELVELFEGRLDAL